MMDSGTTENSKKASATIQMEKSMKENGLTVSLTERELKLGQTVANMTESGIRESLLGQDERSIRTGEPKKDSGKTGYSLKGLVSHLLQLIFSQGGDNGGAGGGVGGGGGGRQMPNNINGLERSRMMNNMGGRS